MRLKKLSILVLSGVVLTGTLLTGCGSMNADKTVATVNGTQISLGLANYMAQYTAVDYDTYYMSYFGQNMWTRQTGDNEETMTDRVKSNTLDSLEEYYLLEEHMDDYGVSLTEDEMAKIEAAAADFMSVNTDEALETMGATEEYVREQLRLATLQQKMYDAIVAGADTNVSDEECAQKTFSYVRVTKAASGDDKDTKTDEEAAAEAQDKAQQILDEALAGSTEDPLDTAAKAHDANKSTCSYGTKDLQSEDDNSTYLELEVLQAADKLGEGEYDKNIIDTEKYYYVIRMDNLDDKEAAERERQSIISDRKQALYDETVNGYKDSAQWSVDEKVWKPVNFDIIYSKALQQTSEDSQAESTSGSAVDATTDTTSDTTSGTTSDAAADGSADTES